MNPDSRALVLEIAVLLVAVVSLACGPVGGDANKEQPNQADTVAHDARIPAEDVKQLEDGAEPGEDSVEPVEDSSELVEDVAGPDVEGCTPVQIPEGYVGAAKCLSCHQGMHPEVVENWQHSGHSYKLNEVVDGNPPTYPVFVGDWFSDGAFELLPGLALNWTDIAYVIGGYGWKARFIGQDGYIVTGMEANPGVQYNLATAEWASYYTGEKKPYTCGGCHTTGWAAAKDNCPPNPDMPGFQGVYVDPHVSCEACHGPGEGHVSSPSAATIDDGNDSCQNCHIRGDDLEKIPAKGGLIRHHEQVQELLASPHKTFSCSACHDAHASTKYDPAAPGDGVHSQCKKCHGNVEVNAPHDTVATCTDCHMPEIVKSATSTVKGTGDDAVTMGDISGHIFALTLDPEATLTFKDADDAEWASPEVPVIFACKKCHAEKTITEAVQGGAAIHAE